MAAGGRLHVDQHQGVYQSFQQLHQGYFCFNAATGNIDTYFTAVDPDVEKIDKAHNVVMQKLKADMKEANKEYKELTAATSEQRKELDLPGGGAGPLRKRRAPLIMDTAKKVEEACKRVFNAFGSTDALLSYLEKFQILVASQQTLLAKIPENITALNLHFKEEIIRSCWVESYWLREVYEESIQNRESAHQTLVEKIQGQAEAEKDDKKKKSLLAKLGNIKSSFVPFQDSEARYTRMMDAATRLSLRHHPAYKEMTERMESTLTNIADITEKTKSLVVISYIDPADNKEFSIYKRDQEKLSGEARRHQSTVSRYAAAKKKESNDDQAKDNLKEENDRLKQELAKAKGEQLGNFRELFKEMTHPSRIRQSR